MTEGPFDRLHPAIRHHVVNSLGWSTLRPTQLAAIDPILQGRDCLLLAPTAGGKTEAAVIPVLSRMLAEPWQGLSVLYVCPIKALLNNLEQRLSRYAALVGRRVQVWHGDVSQSSKARASREQPDLLLTTPESLEAMLISLRVDRPAWFGNLRAVVVDELHAFAGDDRGWHLRAVLRRIDAYLPRPMQRIGLTATVGNPRGLLDWLTGHQDGVQVGEATVTMDADVVIDYVGGLDNAVTVLARLHRGSKRLVFCDSRSKVEQAAAGLRALGVRTFVSHSSLSAADRREAERAFAEEPDCVIVATSTLELGIDVGDLDHVIQIDAPGSVSSFLQRMGRTGRRSGSRRNCTFLATSEAALLRACAIVSLWRAACIEPVIAPPEPWHLVAQQAMALLLESGGIGRAALTERLSALFPELDRAGIDAVLAHMLATDVLVDIDAILAFGQHGEREYGRRHFVDLVSSFDSPPVLVVRYGAAELGWIDPMSVLRRPGADADEPLVLSLGGRGWTVVSIDWPRATAWVEPAKAAGRSRWSGSARPTPFAMAQAIKTTLAADEPLAALSRRGREQMERIRSTMPAVEEAATLVAWLGAGEERWWTFAGERINAMLRGRLMPGSVDRVDALGLDLSRPLAWRDAGAPDHDESLAVAAFRAVEPKFAGCLPDEVARRMAVARWADTADLQRVLQARVVTIGV